ncbi:hypothetical protein [Paenibacillus glacialis]|uniref:Lipoprotein n=1 Tax=Paenibacillus glacialis TaxID=494026 RepID=A0A168L1A5_9BACL|nr:hypothetical protein [Paenibacillus glacialis]OAB42761.1 hypothetical protein PGLA_11565 [Paenibacillus glacialis]
MRGITWLRALVLLCSIMIVLVGCGNADPSWVSFEGAANEKSFPVPKEGNKKDPPANNSEMNVVRYFLPGLKESDVFPEVYLETIIEWGWQEEVDDQRDAVRVFKKDKKVVQVIVEDDFFVIMVPKATEKSVIRSLENK